MAAPDWFMSIHITDVTYSCVISSLCISSAQWLKACWERCQQQAKVKIRITYIQARIDRRADMGLLMLIRVHIFTLTSGLCAPVDRLNSYGADAQLVCVFVIAGA